MSSGVDDPLGSSGTHVAFEYDPGFIEEPGIGYGTQEEKEEDKIDVSVVDAPTQREVFSGGDHESIAQSEQRVLSFVLIILFLFAVGGIVILNWIPLEGGTNEAKARIAGIVAIVFCGLSIAVLAVVSSRNDWAIKRTRKRLK